MESAEERILINTMDEKIREPNRGSKNYSPGLRALLSMKKLTATLENDYSGFLKIENELYETHKIGLLIIETNTSPTLTVRWKEVLQEADRAVQDIHKILSSVKENHAKKEKESYAELWKEMATHLSILKDSSINAATSGWRFLPSEILPQWEREFVNLEAPLVESLILHVDSCRVLLKMVESYTPDEMNAITRMIADHIPVDIPYEEAVHYQDDYNKALENFKNEFKKEKNLWDKFLDILAGGTHQSPSERVMMARWVEGEELNL